MPQCDRVRSRVGYRWFRWRPKGNWRTGFKACVLARLRARLFYGRSTCWKARCIGQITLAPKPGSTAWSLAFWLNPAHWGRGLAIDTVSPILGFAFDLFDIPELRAGVAHWNHRSIDTLKRLGLRFLRDNPAGYVVWGVTEPVHEFHLTKEPFRGQCNA